MPPYRVIPYHPYAEMQISPRALPPLSWYGNRKQLHYALSDVTLDDITVTNMPASVILC